MTTISDIHGNPITVEPGLTSEPGDESICVGYRDVVTGEAGVLRLDIASAQIFTARLAILMDEWLDRVFDIKVGAPGKPEAIEKYKAYQARMKEK